MARSKELTPAIREQSPSDAREPQSPDPEGRKSLQRLKRCHRNPKIMADDMLAEVDHEVEYQNVFRMPGISANAYLASSALSSKKNTP
ncbi:uncharacterized protein N7515_009987 [Penicillium bovifimosum]|uniref:Uncharacterized protein n=1 Tax=Penicillium bovifimosum TaxID=126998 RepID=A0A9W9GIQ8_9EURO|nr:uncharacterized protein N7515_009987 [Penicillium bovifimosum]KAJ5120599.1 hypothetical protein N7515_009987 [Penicillium bovifimosum]